MKKTLFRQHFWLTLQNVHKPTRNEIMIDEKHSGPKGNQPGPGGDDRGFDEAVTAGHPAVKSCRPKMALSSFYPGVDIISK